MDYIIIKQKSDILMIIDNTNLSKYYFKFIIDKLTNDLNGITSKYISKQELKNYIL